MFMDAEPLKELNLLQFNDVENEQYLMAGFCLHCDCMHEFHLGSEIMVPFRI